MCSRSFAKNVIEVHAANCEGRTEEAEDDFEHVEVDEVAEAVANSNADVNMRSANSVKLIECPICNQSYDQTVIEEHAANCGEEVYV